MLASRRSVASSVLESGALAMFIVGVYAVVVVALGSRLTLVAGSELWLTVGATAVVAISAGTVRRRARRFADRVVYGRQAEPYEVLSGFARHVEASDLLDRVARSLARATTAIQASVWLADLDGLVRATTWPPTERGSEPARATDVVSISGADMAVAVVHDGEVLGALALTAAPHRALLPADERLLGQLAGALALALRNERQVDELRRQVDELHASRQRIVALQDETRRRLERDLHDGAQQRLVAIKVTLGRARWQAERAGDTGLTRPLLRLSNEADAIIGRLRTFAHGAYPPLLETEGLRAAIVDHVRRSPIPVTVRAPGSRRYAGQIETTAYACVVEALDNVVRHSGARSAEVVVQASDGELRLEVTDDGAGFDPRTVDREAGLTRLADRLDAVDASLSITSSPTSGTTIRCSIPARPVRTAPIRSAT